MQRVPLRPRRRRRRAPVMPIALPLLIITLIVFAIYFVTSYPKDVEKIVYPLDYTELIDQYSAEYQLDPARVAAVIYCESSFRPEALSSVGARGLMQIMPETGAWIASKLGESDGYNDEKLFDPEVSIRYGCWYLNYLNGRFDGDMTKVTAAYHAGGGSVDQWLADDQYSLDGVTLKDIPYKNTKQYVERVANAYNIYKETYSS